MPFVPSSPIRLYATRRSRTTSTTDSTPSPTASKGSAVSEPRDSFPSMTLRTATDPNSTMFASEDVNQQSPSRGSLVAKEIDTDRQSPYRDLEGAERTLTIQEALATVALDEDATTRESSLPAMIRPQSTLFDNTSESEYCIEEDVRPIVGRASSVRVSKPLIVEKKPTKTTKFQVKQSSHSRSNSRSSLKAERVSGSLTETLPTMPEEGSQQYSGQTIRPVMSRESNDISPRIVSESFETTKSPLPASTSARDLYGEVTPSIAACDSALPTGSTLHSVHPRIIQPDMPSVASIGESSVSPIQKPERTTSASLPSPGQGLSRRVKIRPADLITKNHHNRLSFRETVVTTPFPPQLPDETTSMESDGLEREGPDEGPSKRKSRREKEKQRISFPSSSREKDRFPSPERPEVLFLDLNLHNHPGARVTLEIEIADRTTFDDEALFQQIKAAYREKLLNWPRRVFSLVRKAIYVTATGTTQSTHSYRSLFNSADFLQHIHDPHLGRRRKIWILWLRNQNANLLSTQTSNNTPRIRHLDNLTRLSTRARSAPHSRHSSQSTKSPHTDKDPDNTNEHQRLSTASDTSSFYFAYSPMIQKLPFLSTRHDNSNFHSKMYLNETKSPCRSFFWPSNPTPSPDCESPRRLTITFHHSFRLSIIVILTLLNFLFAVLCAAIWTLFGVPGTRPGMDDRQQIGRGRENVTIASDWRVNAQGRVLTGVVIGFVVLVLGSLGEALLLWMGWLLL